MTGHELLPWAIAIFAVTNTVGAALSVARVYSQRKKKQQQLAPSLHSTRTRDSAYVWRPGQAEPEKSNVITIVMATAAVMAVASALLALAH
ncbi:MAG TPA: hypothetical protein VFQ87_00435 [Bradyrhizobium sp.]|nr:hypothetical protein [Bradyrhizobium sp.]